MFFFAFRTHFQVHNVNTFSTCAPVGTRRLACDGIWALVELGPLLCIPMPFSVRNSSRSMYWSWNKPPSHGSVLSQSSGPRKADWELGRNELEPRFPPPPPDPPPLTPSESSSESRGLSLSLGRRQSSNFKKYRIRLAENHHGNAATEMDKIQDGTVGC